MNNNYFFTSLFCILFTFSNYAQQNWTILMYADPCTEITEAVIKNITDLVCSYQSDDITVYIQLQLYMQQNPDRAFAWRYVVRNRSLVFIDTIEVENDPAQNLTTAIDWAFAKQDSKYHGIIIAGHGSGILEPMYDTEYETFALQYDEAVDSLQSRKHAYQSKSILLNELNGTYINNDMMIQTMSHACKILNKKIDLLGFDLCFGSCIEHAYQLAPFVNYFVGCQNIALVEGFDYYQLGEKLQESACTPRQLAHHLVQSYKNYYESVAPEAPFALSAIKLSAIDNVVQAFDTLSISIMDLMVAHPELIDKVIQARKKSFHAYLIPMYTDLYDFIQHLEHSISPLLSEDEKNQVHQNCRNVLSQIKKAVSCTVCNHNLLSVHGLNIYYPYNIIENSYYTTQFAQNSNWLNFLMFINEHYA